MRKVLPLIFILILALGVQAASDNGRIVLAYVTSGNDIMPDPNSVTHINYAFGSVDSTFSKLKIANPERLRAIVALKKDNPQLKVMLSIGGWTSGRFSEMAADPKKRLSFAVDCKRAVEEFTLDGIDIDWEYPTSRAAGISASPDDTRNFTLLMRDIRTGIGSNKLLTFASEANALYVDFKAVMPYVDFVNIMMYDISRPPMHHAALFRSDKTSKVSCDESVELHRAAGVPYSKLVLGIPFYGHGKKKVPDSISYKAILELNGYTHEWDDVAKVPYLADEHSELVCSYDDARSIGYKCAFIRRMGLKGAMYWEYACDDDAGTLRNAVYKGMMLQ